MSANITASTNAPIQNHTWLSIKHLSTQAILDILVEEKKIDVDEVLQTMLARNIVKNARVTLKCNLEKVWKECVEVAIVDGRNRRL